MNPVAFASPNGLSATDSVANLPRGGQRRRRIGNPYGFWDSLACVRNVLSGPVREHSNLTRFLPTPHVLAEIQPGLTIAFLGDLMPTGGKNFRFGDALRRFIGSADCLVVNLEGVIAADRFV